jgi:hypothetical protein
VFQEVQEVLLVYLVVFGTMEVWLLTRDLFTFTRRWAYCWRGDGSSVGIQIILNMDETINIIGDGTLKGVEQNIGIFY